MQRSSSGVNIHTPAGKYETAARKAKEVKIDPKPESLLRLALPLYGGTTPVTTVPAATQPVVDPAQQQQAAPQATQEPNPAGGSDDPIAKLAADPNALGQLLSQVETLTKELDKAKGSLKEHEDAKAEEERKRLTKEQQLEADLAQRDAIIQQMDSVIKNQALANAMNSVEGIQWNSVKQALAELKSDEFEIQVDLENGTAKVDGLKEAAQRIAKDYPWLVKKPEGTPPPTNQTRQTRTVTSSGNPPKPPNPAGEAKQVKRDRLMKRYGVLKAGRAAS